LVPNGGFVVDSANMEMTQVVVAVLEDDSDMVNYDSTDEDLVKSHIGGGLQKAEVVVVVVADALYDSLDDATVVELDRTHCCKQMYMVRMMVALVMDSLPVAFLE
jgi:ABC-type enterochelin transport system ATPase subunit